MLTGRLFQKELGKAMKLMRLLVEDGRLISNPVGIFPSPIRFLNGKRWFDIEPGHRI